VTSACSAATSAAEARAHTLGRVEAAALEALEFPAIAARVAAAAETPLGAELALALTPSGDTGEVAHRQALTSEAVALLDLAEEAALRGVADVREAAARAERGSVLEPSALRAVARAIGVGLAARSALAARRETAPLLADLLAPLDESLGALAEAIDRAVEDDGGGVRDRATPTLRRLRSELRDGRL